MRMPLVLLALTLPLAAAEMSVPDLLLDVKARTPMQLSQFEQLALASNPTLQQANAQVRQSAGLVKQAGLLPNPVIGYQGEQIRGGSYAGGEQGAFLQQTFVLGGKLGLRKDLYRQEQRVDEIGVQEQRYRVLGDVGMQFYAALAAQETVRLRERLLAIASDAVETAHQLANVGQADAPDVLQAEVEAEQAKIDFTTAQRMYLQQFAKLASVTGRGDLSPSPLTGNLEQDPAVDADHAIDHIMKESPSVKRAEQDIARAEAQVRSAKRESIPDLQVHAGLQNNFEPIGQPRTSSVGVQGFVTAGMTLPLFNRNQGNAAAAEADVERAHAEVSRVRLSLGQITQPVLQDYLIARDQAARYKAEMLPRAEKAYRLYLTKYQQMGAAYPQVIVSQRTWFQLQVAYVGVLAQAWRDAVQLNNFLLGDGLEMPISRQVPPMPPSGAAAVQ